MACIFVIKYYIITTVLLLYYYWLKPNIEVPKKDPNIIYILDWKPAYSSRYVTYYGNKTVVDRNCKFQNCYITPNKTYFLGDLTLFDAILFNGAYFVDPDHLPHVRSKKQVYIFGTLEPSAYIPVTKYNFSSFFNWTLTYRLDSDVTFPYMTIRDKEFKIVGPKIDMEWIDSEAMEKTDLDEKFKRKLDDKSKAAAWLVSRLRSKSKREEFVKDLVEELNKYNLSIDIHGKCGTIPCKANFTHDCLAEMSKDYHFYLAFENSFCEDYVSEKLLHAINNDMVPIVYGGANYSRFLPGSSYLNARMLGPKELARQMNETIHNKKLYYSYFKWRNFYTYHAPRMRPDSDAFCRLCESLNLGLSKDDQAKNKEDNKGLNSKNYKSLNFIEDRMKNNDEDDRRNIVIKDGSSNKHSVAVSSKYDEDNTTDGEKIYSKNSSIVSKHKGRLSWSNGTDFNRNGNQNPKIRKNYEDFSGIYYDEALHRINVQGFKTKVYEDFASWWNRHEHTIECHYSYYEECNTD